MLVPSISHHYRPVSRYVVVLSLDPEGIFGFLVEKRPSAPKDSLYSWAPAMESIRGKPASCNDANESGPRDESISDNKNGKAATEKAGAVPWPGSTRLPA